MFGNPDDAAACCLLAAYFLANLALAGLIFEVSTAGGACSGIL